MKKFIYSMVGLSFLGLNYANAALSLGGSKVDQGLKGSDQWADTAVQVLIKNAITFLYLVAVVYGLYGWFNILTAGGNDEKVKKWKTIIIQALIGLVVIWLASSVVQWLVNSILWSTN